MTDLTDQIAAMLSKPTNTLINEILATGELGLPEGLSWNRHGFWTTYGVDSRDVEIPDQQAHDLIACEWAREVDHERVFRRDGKWLDAAQDAFNFALLHGDSEAAIRAIHAALCGEQP